MQVRVTLTNRKAKFHKPYPWVEFSRILRFHPKSYEHMPNYKRMYWNPETEKQERVWDGYAKLLRYDAIGAGLFLAKKKELEELGVEFIVDDQRTSPKFINFTESNRDYQNECIQAMHEAAKTGGIVLNAVGTGKTLIAGLFFKGLAGSGLFIVDELTLLKQARKEIGELTGEEIGIVGKSEFDPRRITVATIQTLDRHQDEKPFFKWASGLDVAIYDEVHNQLNKRAFESVKNIQPKAVYGLTATLQLKHEFVSLPAFNLCGPIIYNYPIEQGVEEKYLVPGVAISVHVSQVGSRFERYPDAYRRLIVNSSQRNQLLIDIIQEAHKRKYKQMIFVQRVAHLKQTSDRLTELGIKHAVAYGEINADAREQIQKDIEANRVNVIVANTVFKKGINIPRINFIIDAAGLKDQNDAIQKYGRGTRLAPNKKGLIYIDITDRHPSGVTQTDKNRNPFHRAGISRRKAFKAENITLKSTELTDAVEIVDFAERVLKKECQKSSRNGL